MRQESLFGSISVRFFSGHLNAHPIQRSRIRKRQAGGSTNRQLVNHRHRDDHVTNQPREQAKAPNLIQIL